MTVHPAKLTNHVSLLQSFSDSFVERNYLQNDIKKLFIIKKISNVKDTLRDNTGFCLLMKIVVHETSRKNGKINGTCCVIPTNFHLHTIFMY